MNRKWICALLLCALALLQVCGAAADELVTYADTIAWDGAYDVVVVGFGGAGAAAAKAAADEGASVLLLEKAPEGSEGGNTRLSGQIWINGGSVEGVSAYLHNMVGQSSDVSEEMIRVFAEGTANMAKTLEEEFGADPSRYTDWAGLGVIDYLCPEYPHFEGSEDIRVNTITETIFKRSLWDLIRQNVVDRADSIDVWYESPAVSLIQDPESKTIVGVVAERDGQTLRIRANNGVCLTCGGFENNAAMIDTYLGLRDTAFAGTPYNTGDGIRMAMEVGADLWHMSTYATGAFDLVSGTNGTGALWSMTSGSMIIVGDDGSRYLNETEDLKHGHGYYHGSYRNIAYTDNSFYVLDQKKYDELMANPAMAAVAQYTVSADTLATLADACGMKADVLERTIAQYNDCVAGGEDIFYGRDIATMGAFDAEGPYYAIRVIPLIGNTFGGPRRNENAEVLDTHGNPIPHLYSAGELGSMTCLYYQGGWSNNEDIVFGTLAGKNAAQPKEPLPATLAAQKAESPMTYTLGVMSDLLGTGAAIETAENEFIGCGEGGMGGTITVRLTVDGGTITAIEVVDSHETPGIGTVAMDAMIPAMLASQSADVDGVAGATLTSEAFIAAVKDAMAKIQ